MDINRTIIVLWDVAYTELSSYVQETFHDQTNLALAFAMTVGRKKTEQRNQQAQLKLFQVRLSFCFVLERFNIDLPRYSSPDFDVDCSS